MKILDAIFNSAFRDIRESVHVFAHDMVSSYIEKVKANLSINSNYYSNKDIHDAVWGTIQLNAGEIIIIDSPLIQRLRRINHLGLAGLLFPGADYSRFEHTLGVLYVANKISKKMQDDNPRNNEYPDYHWPIQICRLASIFHDCGHFFCSHASEYYFDSPYYSNYSEVKALKKYFTNKIGVTNPKLSEIIAAFIVTSPAVAELLCTAWPFLKTEALPIPEDARNQAGFIASLILGVPTTIDLLPFSRIISGPIDADKCDYLARDSSHTGVPVAVDLYRVIQKLTVVKKSPKEFGKVFDDNIHNNEKMYEMSISYSAIKSVEEILISRSLMHEKIYYHHKILTSEVMLRYSLRLLDLSGFSILKVLGHALKLTDHELLSNSPEYFLKALLIKGQFYEALNDNYFLEACNVLKKLVHRDLLKRACTIHTDTLTPTSSANHDSAKIISLIFSVIDKNEQVEFIDEIKNETIKIFKHLRSDFNIDNIEIYILSVAYPQHSFTSGFNIPVSGYSGSFMTSREYFQGETWDNSRKPNIALNYIVGNPELLYEIYLATEKVLFIKYGMLLEHESYEMSKLYSDKLIANKNELTKKEYYIDSIQIIPDDVFSPEHLNKIAEILDKYRGYEGPTGYKIESVSQITSFLKQFLYIENENTEVMFTDIISILDNVIILDREKIVQSFIQLINGAGNHFKCGINSFYYSVFGGMKDSSTHMSYYLNDVSNQLKSDFYVDTISNILNPSFDINKPIVLFDDAFYSGKQTIAIFQEMCGVSLNEREIDETHNVILTGTQKDQLKKAKIALCYCYANTDKIDEIEAKLISLGFNIKILYAHAFPQPIFENSETVILQSKMKVKQIFKTIGLELIKSSKINNNGKYNNGWSEERIENSALGYNNAQQYLVLRWNTPTYTLTPLWASGTLGNGEKWIPLFPRQSK